MGTYLLANKNTKIKWSSWDIELDDILPCYGGAVYHPTNFFVSTKSSWNELEGLMKELKNFYKKGIIPGTNGKKEPQPAEKNPYYTPIPKTLQRGLFVAVYHLSDWHRGLILQSFHDIQQYQILMIDYGDHKIFPLSKIRYISQLFLEKLAAQTIKCSFLKSSKPSTSNEIQWSEAESASFLKALQRSGIEIEFVEYEIEDELFMPMIWKVRVFRKRANGDLLELQEIPVNSSEDEKDDTLPSPTKPNVLADAADDATTHLTKNLKNMAL